METLFILKILYLIRPFRIVTEIKEKKLQFFQIHTNWYQFFGSCWYQSVQRLQMKV